MEKAQYAGFWIRCYATFIDILAMLLFISVPLTLIYGAAYWQSNHGILGFWDVFLGYIVPFVATNGTMYPKKTSQKPKIP